MVANKFTEPGGLNKPRAVLQVFCKAPIEGTVKTRLAAAIGNAAATALYETMLIAVIEAALKVRDVSVEIWCSPDANHPFFDRYRGRVRFCTQSAGDLGDRMYFAMTNRLDRGAPVLLMGADCPLIGVDYINEAIEALRDADAVIAPTEDGGYGLIGFWQVMPEPFTDVDWSTDRVFAQTHEC